YMRYMSDGEALLTLYSNYKSIEKRLDQLEKKDLLNIAGIIKGDHSIFGILGAVSGGIKSYKGGDMFLASSGGSDEIQVNISAALRLYDKGKELLEDKKGEIKNLQSAVAREIESWYKQEKRKVMKQIEDIETNPTTYAFVLHKPLPTFGLSKQVHHMIGSSELQPLQSANM